MKYMLMRKADTLTEQGVMPSQELLAAMGAYNLGMSEAGVFVDGNGLAPTSEGCRIEFRGGEATVIRGPLPETTEQLAGYSILEVSSLEEAIEWARKWPREDGDGTVNLELRRYYEMSDFEPGHGLDRIHQQSRLPSGMNVHLSFPGNCREAMTFYASVTGGSLATPMTYGESPAADQVPGSMHDKVIHAALNIRGRWLMGADMAAECYQPIQGVQVQLEYTDPAQAQMAFEQLAEGGRISMPFAETFWAHRFGMLTDRYGVGWMINCQAAPCGLREQGEPS